MTTETDLCIRCGHASPKGKELCRPCEEDLGRQADHLRELSSLVHHQVRIGKWGTPKNPPPSNP